MRKMTLSLALLLGAALPAQADLFLHAGFAGPTPEFNVPITRAIDLDGNGTFDTARELFAFQRKYHSLASKNCFIMGLATAVEEGRIVFYGADSGDSASGECYLFRSVDRDGNGVIEGGESVLFADFGQPSSGHSPDGVAPVVDGQGRRVLYVTNDALGIQGLWRCRDLNRDGDALDSGETLRWAHAGSGLKLGATPLSLGDLQRIERHPGGGAVAYNDGDYTNPAADAFAWLRFQEDNQGNPVVSNFLNSSAVNKLPRNVDFAGGKLIDVDLHYLSGTVSYRINDLVRATLSPAGFKGRDAWYFSTYCKAGGQFGNRNRAGRVISGLVFRGLDNNQDGDLNDSGEIQLFYNGSGAAAPGGTIVGTVQPVTWYDHIAQGQTTLCDGIDGIDVVGETVYVAYEPAPGAVAVLALHDTNRNLVIDSGEAKQVLWMTTPLPPVYSTKFGADVRGIVALPAGSLADPQPAGVRPYGEGCTGSGGLRPLGWTRGGAPTPGNGTFAWHLSRGPVGGAALLLLGVSRSTSALGPLPLALDPIGMAGCSLYTDILFTVNLILDGAGRGQATLPVPGNPALQGLSLYGQFMAADPGANPAGLVATAGLEVTVR